MAPLSVGFARGPGNLIEVQVVYGGRRGPWLLDSAAGWHVLHRGMHPIEQGEAVESLCVDIEGEGVEADTLEGELLQLGRFRQQPDQVLAVDLPYRATTGQPIQGLLGYPLFAEIALTIDWDQQTLILDGPPPFEVTHELPLRLEDRQALIPLQLAGEALEVRLETAYAGGLLIEAESFDIERFASPEESGGPVRFETTGLRCRQQALPSWPAVHVPQTGAVLMGRLGLGILSRYTCHIDYPGERLLLAPRKQATPVAAKR
ncbi:MAG: hypothetical protein GEEBNDBF_02601 [bacterium]|nr:hypothetical protein [bacterium]